MNFIDKIVNYFDPKSGLTRVQSRARLKILNDQVRKYEGASRSNRTKHWTTTNSDANAEIRQSFRELVNRSRDLVRNTPIGERTMCVFENNIVGKGIQAQFYSDNKKTQDLINSLWVEWADSSSCDYADISTLTMLQRLGVRMLMESGEILARIHIVQDDDIPLRLELLEPDFINTLQTKPLGVDNYLIDGIEIDSRGRRVGYNLYKVHPGSQDINSMVKGKFESFFLPAKWMIHAYKINRAGQLRGVPILAPVIISLREFDEYMDAQLVKQKISAMMTAFITDPNGSSDMTDEEIEVASHFEPGAINILGPGQSVEVANPPSIDGFRDFTNVTLREIATGVGLSYEALSGDLSQVNFSSARMGWLEMARNVDVWREQVFIPMFMERVVKAFVYALELKGIRIPNDLTWKYTAPKREMIDPTKEIPATIKGIRAGLITLTDAIKQNGCDPDVHLQEIAEMNQKIDDGGFIFESDPRKDSDRLEKTDTPDDAEDENDAEENDLDENNS